MSVHAAAATGFGRADEEYERGRPDYPAPARAQLIATLGLRPGRSVLDLAAGTGKLTRALAETGAEVIAVEPVPGMRARLLATTPEARVLAGTAERIPLDDGSVHAVTVAQAFHWFDARAAAGEIHRVLRPRGRLAVIWNAWDENVPWVSEVMGIVHAHAAGAPQQRTSPWARRLAATALFSPLTQNTFPNLVTGGRDVLVARILSTSYIAALPAPGREQVARDVLAIADRDPATAGREMIAMPYTTHVSWCEAR